MANTTQMMIRCPVSLLAVIDEAARQASISRTQFVLDALRAAVGDEAEPPMVLGWIAFDRPGELAEGDAWECPECGQDMTDPHIGIMSNGVLTPVVCGGCAQSA